MNAKRKWREDATAPERQRTATPRDACAGLPEGYGRLLADLETRIAGERVRAVLSANAAMVMLYWDVGRAILERQERDGWGARVIDRLSRDLRSAFPDMSGLSVRNLLYMRQFAAAWPDRENVQRTVAQLPWRSNLTLLQKIHDPQLRLWYAEKALELGLSRDMLALQIESRLHEREGRAQTNFPATLPPADSDLATQIFKDPYVFDFLGTATLRREAELEQQLIDHIQRFLLELKSGRFEPEHIGKLNMYLNAVDDILGHADDKPSIGLLLVKEKDRVVVEYALAGTGKPMGVAVWEREITRSLPEELKASLPSVEEIEAELARAPGRQA